MRFCKRCLLPEIYPGLELDQQGYCNACHEYDKKFAQFDPEKAKKELRKILTQETSKNQRLVITCSGGMDSSYVAYLCRAEYDLDVIMANFNHGFQSEICRQNLLNLSKLLDIPIATIDPDFDVMYRLYRDFFLKTGDFCTPCCQGCCRAGFMVADDNDTTTIIHGGVAGSRVEFNVLGMYKHHYERFMKIAGSSYTIEQLRNIVTPTKDIKKYRLISFPQYFDWDARHIVKTLKNEVKWQTMPNERTWRVDCIIAEAADHFLQRKFGFSRHWMIISANLRAGLYDIDEAREMLKKQEQGVCEEPKEAVDLFLSKTGLSRNMINELPFFNTEPAINSL